MVEVPTDVISYDSELVMTYIQEFANFTQVPRPSYNTIQMAEYLRSGRRLTAWSPRWTR